MKATITYNDMPVEIELTKEQIATVKKSAVKITDRIKTFEDACGALGLVVSDLFNNNDTSDEIGYKKLKVVVRALNEGWEPDWSNSNEYKYYAYFNMDDKSSGLGLSYYVFDFDSSISDVGSRLVFKSKELAIYAAEQFTAIYKEFYIIQK